MGAHHSNPHSCIRIPHSVAGVLVVYAAPAARWRSDNPTRSPKDTVTLTPVVVNATRLPAVSEVVRGLTGRTATLDGSDLDSRGVRTLADALEELPGVTTADELGAPAQLDVTLRGFQVSPRSACRRGSRYTSTACA